MAFTVNDLYKYDPNFDPLKIQRLTGKKDFKKDDTIDLSRVEGLNDKDLSIFIAEKEGSSFLSKIRDNNTRFLISDAAGFSSKDYASNTKNNNTSIFEMPKSQWT